MQRRSGALVVAWNARATRPEPTSSRERKTLKGTSGCSALASMNTKAAKRAADSTNEPRVLGEARPASSARVQPYTRSASAAVTVIAPAASSLGGAEGSVLSGNRNGASTTPRAPTGTVAKNTHSHPGPWTRKPPTIQPEAPPPAWAAVQKPTARLRPSPSG